MRAHAVVVVLLVIALPGVAVAESAPAWIEPDAGRWATWVIGAPRTLRVPPPPAVADAQEIDEVRELVARRDAAALAAIAYWDTGPPSYRWNQLAVAELLRRDAYSNVAARDLALLHVALHDAMVAGWDAKYAHRRLRPGADITTAVALPRSPSYPDERAVAAGAAAGVLSALYPERASFFDDRADEAARSRVQAGVSYPRDVRAGLALGRQVAKQVMERGQRDGSDRPWNGRVPAEPGKWHGVDPVLPQAGTWLTWTLTSASELRPPPPPDSDRMMTELAELRAVTRTQKRTADALFWEHAAGGRRSFQFWNDILSRTVLEHRLDDNAPRAARAYAAVHVAFHDVGVACWDAKYAYWAVRPAQLRPGVQPLFSTPNHPSYPSGHSCFGSAVADVLAYLFPRDAAAFHALAREAAESRVWAGIHFRSDIEAGRALGGAVARRVIERLERDGPP